MKRIFLGLAIIVALFGITTFEQYMLMPPSVRAQTNTFCASNLACTVTGVWSFSSLNNTTFTGTSIFSGAITATAGQNVINSKQLNSVIYVDGVTYTGAQALQSAIQACSGSVGCEVDARDPVIGTQTFTVNPLSGLNMPITLLTGPYTVQWDHAAFFVDFPSNFHWVMDNTNLLNSTGSVGVGVNQLPGILGYNTFLGTRIYQTTCTVTNGSTAVTVGSATNLTVGAMLACIGASGGNTNQATTANGATGTGASFTVTSTAGWDISGAKTNYLQIDSEELFCTSGTATTFTNCTRGINGTTNISHVTTSAVNAVGALISEIVSISGTTVNIVDAATFTVTGATAYSGVSNVTIEGNGTFNGFQTLATATRFLEGLAITYSTNVTVNPGIRIKNFDHGGLFVSGSRYNNVSLGHLSGIGKAPSALGSDVWCFEQCSNNTIKTGQHSQGVDTTGTSPTGDILMFIDDRSVNFTINSGPSNDNVVDLDSAFNYTQGVIIQGGSSRNLVRIGKLKLNSGGGGNAIEINAADWTTQPTPTDNTIYFQSVDATGVNALITTGYAGPARNMIFGGSVIGGVVSAIAGDYVSYLGASGTTNGVRIYSGAENFAQLVRSNGTASQPDVFAKAGQLVIGGGSGGAGDVIFGATTRTLFPEQAITNCAGAAAFSWVCADSGDHFLKYNPNNQGEQHMPQAQILTSAYTNATTGFTTVTGGQTFSFPVKANTNYVVDCHLYYQAAATGGLNIQFTGPAAPTQLRYAINAPLSVNTNNTATASAFSASLGAVVTTAATDFDAAITLGLVNGANAGTVVLQAKSSAAVNLTIQPGSYCQVQ